MSRNDTIGIVGRITSAPKLVADASDSGNRVYEAKLTRKRRSDTEDTYIVQFEARAAGDVGGVGKITEGVEVLIGGEIRTENVKNPCPEESRVKIYIFAQVIAVNMPKADDQNEVKICGYVCKKPVFRKTKRKIAKGKNVVTTNFMVAVTTPTGTNYIPCVCWNWMAYSACTLSVGDYVEIYGRLQSRRYKKEIEGKEVPYIRTAYEVSVTELENRNRKRTGDRRESDNAERITDSAESLK